MTRKNIKSNVAKNWLLWNSCQAFTMLCIPAERGTIAFISGAISITYEFIAFQTLMDQDVILMKLNIKHIWLVQSSFVVVAIFHSAICFEHFRKWTLSQAIAWNQIVWIIYFGFLLFFSSRATISMSSVCVWRSNKFSFDIKLSSIHWILPKLSCFLLCALLVVCVTLSGKCSMKTKRREINDVNIKSQMQPKSTCIKANI